MNKVKQFLSKVKGWGLTALLFLGVGLYLWIFTDLDILTGISFGIFGTRNWDIIKTAVEDIYSDATKRIIKG